MRIRTTRCTIPAGTKLRRADGFTAIYIRRHESLAADVVSYPDLAGEWLAYDHPDEEWFIVD